MQRKLSHHNVKWLARLLPLLLILGACATGSIREKVLTLPVIEGASYVGQETCLECHDYMEAAFAKSIHGRLADFEMMGAEKGCESCHGPGSLHVDAEGEGRLLSFAALNSGEVAAVCSKCHSDRHLMEWTYSEHALSDVSCSDCHVVHQEKATKYSLKKQDPDLCYSCHQEQQAKANFPSHHPIKEGKMNCSDCHNPHGELKTDEQARDLCLNCHSRYQGPFVFEHAPVEEDCSMCHDPHGTVANNLLQQNEPFLCLQCHESHFHAARVGGTKDVSDTFNFDANKLNDLQASDPAAYNDIISNNMTPSQAMAAGYDVTVTFTNANGAQGWSQAFLTKCTTCHGEVHGSDLPSQTAPVIDADGQGFPDGGFGLTR